MKWYIPDCLQAEEQQTVCIIKTMKDGNVLKTKFDAIDFFGREFSRLEQKMEMPMLANLKYKK